MDPVYFIIRRQNTNIFTDATESSSVYDLKRTVEGILKRAPEEQQLYKKDRRTMLQDSQSLKDCGFTGKTAGPEDPAELALALMRDDGSFEQLQIQPFSAPAAAANP